VVETASWVRKAGGEVIGITPKDIAAQRAMLARGEQIVEAKRQQAERERLRDTFAAAALSGMLARPDIDDEPLEYHFLCEAAYRWADAMLRERERNGALSACETVPPTLTDEERAAIEVCATHWQTAPASKILRGLLERIG
jgi:hypothetical protein